MAPGTKGQWFIVSAVIATGAFLSISLVLKDFFVVDASNDARTREDFYLWDIRDQFERTVQLSTCNEMQKQLDDLIAFSRSRLQESGYLVYAEYQLTSGKTKSYAYDCAEDDPGTPLVNERVRNIDKGIVVATEKAVYHYNIDPSKVIKGL